MAEDFGGPIDPTVLEEIRTEILRFGKQIGPTLLARNLLPGRPVASYIEEYKVPEIKVSDDEVTPIPRRVPPGDTLKMSKEENSFKLGVFPKALLINEDDLDADNRLYSWMIDAAVRKINKAEDVAFVNGAASVGINGFVTAAEANENGKIVAAGATGKDVNNKGAWAGNDDTFDPYTDILNATFRLDPDYPPTNLIGDRQELGYLKQLDPVDMAPWANKISQLFGKQPGDWSWMVETPRVPNGYAYLYARDPEVAEFLEAKSMTVDADYAREPIGNRKVIIYTVIGIAIHCNQGFVEIVTS